MDRSKRGGKRENAGRKKSDDPKRPFPIRVTESENLKLKEYLEIIRK